MAKIERALISLTDKSGIEGFAKELSDLGVEILSTGGTAAKMREGGIEVMDVSEFTGFPEMLDGRVKTLHPKVHGGILNQRANPDHQKQCAENGLKNIDLIAVNLYAFEKQEDKIWFEIFNDMHKLALTRDCKAIVGDSANPRVAEINAFVGAKCISSKYIYML